MKQLLQPTDGRRAFLSDVPEPACHERGALVRTAYSCISPGTERAVMELAQGSLIAKMRKRPDLVKKFFKKLRTEGLVSSLQSAKSRLSESIALGYSASGIVVAVGPECRGFQKGDLVACVGSNVASHAEFLSVPQTLMALIPHGVSLRDASLAGLAAIALHGVHTLAPKDHSRIAVIGLGIIGQLTARILKAYGHTPIGYDLFKERSALLEPDGVVGYNAARAYEHASSCDGVIITAASTTKEPLAIAGILAQEGSTIVIVGDVVLAASRKLFYEKELTIRLSRSYGEGRYDNSYLSGFEYSKSDMRWSIKKNCEEYLHLLNERSISLTTLPLHDFPFEKAPDAYTLFSNPQPPLTILLSYTAREEKRAETKPQTLGLQKKDTLRIGVVGAGTFAQSVLLPILRTLPKTELVALVAHSPSSIEYLCKEFHPYRIVRDEQELFAATDIEGVIITTPHALHGTEVLRALRAGKHVYIEKPLCVTIEELTKIKEEIEARSAQRLFVGYNRRFAPLINALMTSIPSDEPIHLFYRIKAGALPQHHWLSGSHQNGRLIGECCHFIDLFQYIARSPLATIISFPNTTHDPKDPSYAITLTTQSGSSAQILYETMGGEVLAKEYLEIHARGISCILNDFRELIIHTNHTSTKKLWNKDKGYREELSTFAASFKGERDYRQNFDELFRVSRATIAAHEQPGIIHTI